VPCAPSSCAAPRLWAVTARGVIAAARNGLPTSRAGTDTVPSVRRSPRNAGWTPDELLPVEYFQVVFTLPHALYDLLARNARLIYSLLFRTAAATLSAFAHDPR
jgi:hypothetical protein